MQQSDVSLSDSLVHGRGKLAWMQHAKGCKANENGTPSCCWPNQRLARFARRPGWQRCQGLCTQVAKHLALDWEDQVRSLWRRSVTVLGPAGPVDGWAGTSDETQVLDYSSPFCVHPKQSKTKDEPHTSGIQSLARPTSPGGRLPVPAPRQLGVDSGCQVVE
jgi:hypothetical protein